MAVDALLVLQASGAVTQTTNSTGLNLVTGTPRRGLVARVIYSAAANSSGSNTAVFSIEHSDDDTTYYALSSAAASTVTMNDTAKSGEINIPFSTTKAYVRLVTTIAGTGTSPTITRNAYIGNVYP